MVFKQSFFTVIKRRRDNGRDRVRNLENVLLLNQLNVQREVPFRLHCLEIESVLR